MVVLIKQVLAWVAGWFYCRTNLCMSFNKNGPFIQKSRKIFLPTCRNFVSIFLHPCIVKNKFFLLLEQESYASNTKCYPKTLSFQNRILYTYTAIHHILGLFSHLPMVFTIPGGLSSLCSCLPPTSAYVRVCTFAIFIKFLFNWMSSFFS